jgi:hypothetical protein
MSHPHSVCGALAPLLILIAAGCEQPPMADAPPEDQAAAAVAPAVEAPLASPALSPVASAEPTAGSDAQRPEQGRCHMEACSWSIIKGERLLRREGPYRLYRLTLQSGSSEHPGGVYPAGYSHEVKIDWNSQDHKLFVLCAPEMPAVLVETPEGFQVSVLDFAGGLFGYQMGSEGIYAHACHGRWMTAQELAPLYPAPPREASQLVTGPEQLFETLAGS